MSGLAFADPAFGPNATFAGGEASLADIFSASYDQFLFNSTTNLAAQAMEKAFDERIEESFKATGVRRDNPMRAMHSFPSQQAIRDYGDPVATFMRQIQEDAGRIPDQSVMNRLMRPIEVDAARIAKESDEKAARLFASRPGIGKYLAAFAGSGRAMMHDPIQLPLMLVGGGVGAGRTVATRILSTAAREAFVNGATQAAAEPFIQHWRAKMGLDYGLSQSLSNVAMAAAFGGALGGAGQAIGEGIAKLSGRALDAAGDAAAADGRVAEPLRRAMDGDLAAARETLPEIRDALPAEARGALDHIDSLNHLEANRPASAQPEHHDVTVAAAHRAVDAAEPPRFAVDPDQVERITHSLVGDRPAVDRSNARSLLQFLRDRGGVLDQTGDLAAIGAGDLARKGRGKDRRVPLDAAREAAEEAGYIGRAGETQVTTIADLVDAIDGELRGNKIYSRADAAPQGADTFEAQRAGVERTVAEITRHAGPAVDDRTIAQAAELAIGEGMEPFDALESVLIRAEPDARAATAKAARQALPEAVRPDFRDEPLPGWSDAELEAASAARGPEPTAEKTPFHDPAEIDPELTLTNNDLSEFGDVMLPGASGGPQSLRALVDDIKHGEGLAAIVKACKA